VIYPAGDGALDETVVAEERGVELESGGSRMGGEPARDDGCENGVCSPSTGPPYILFRLDEEDIEWCGVRFKLCWTFECGGTPLWWLIGVMANAMRTECAR